MKNKFIKKVFKEFFTLLKILFIGASFGSVLMSPLIASVALWNLELATPISLKIFFTLILLSVITLFIFLLKI